MKSKRPRDKKKKIMSLSKKAKTSSTKRRTEIGVAVERVNDDNQLVLVLPGTIESTALILHPALEIGEWAPIGIKLRQVREWLQFAIGDWLNHGEAHYGETYVQAATDTGLPEETLMVLKYVSSRVAPERRIKDLTWSHHREVAKFPPEEQVRWLEMALKEGWSVRDLKDALKKAAGKDNPESEEGNSEEGSEEPPTGESCLN